MLMGLFIHFYIIFGTNPLTQGPVQIAVFLPISVFRRKGISNGIKPSGELFLEQKQSRELGVQAREASRRPRDRGRAHPPRHALHSHGPLVAPSTDFFRLYIPIYPKNIKANNRSGVPPPQASIATKNQSGPCFGTLPEGDPSPVAVFIIPTLSMMRRE